MKFCALFISIFQFQLKVHFLVCLIRRVWACLLRRLATWGDLYFRRLQRSGYVFVWSVRWQKTCYRCVFVWWAFFGVVPFSSYWLQTFIEATEMGPRDFFIWEGATRSGKNHNFAIKLRQRKIHVFVPSSVEIREAELTKPVHGIHHEKRLVFGPFLRGSWRNFAEKIIGSLYPHSHPSVKLRPNLSSFRGKYLSDSLQYRREACKFSSTWHGR